MKEKNVGLSLLRIILSYAVICIHFWNGKPVNGFTDIICFFKSCAVATFMLMSFALCGKMFEKCDREKIKSRFIRLAVPQVGWTVIYFALYLLMDVFFGKNKISGADDFFWQLFTGSRKGINQTMWYQVALILMTGLFVLVFSLLKKKGIYVLIALSVLVLILEYCGAIEFIFGWRYELSSLFGRFVEFIPIATVGYLVFLSGKLSLAKKHPYISTLIFLVAVVFAYFVDVIPVGGESNYHGLDLIVSAFAVFMFFYLLPLDKLPETAKNVINEIASYSLGVYCMHRLVETVLRGILEVAGVEAEFSSLGACFVIFLVCLAVSFVTVRLVKNKWVRMLFE